MVKNVGMRCGEGVGEGVWGRRAWNGFRKIFEDGMRMKFGRSVRKGRGEKKGVVENGMGMGCWKGFKRSCGK